MEILKQETLYEQSNLTKSVDDFTIVNHNGVELNNFANLNSYQKIERNILTKVKAAIQRTSTHQKRTPLESLSNSVIINVNSLKDENTSIELNSNLGLQEENNSNLNIKNCINSNSRHSTLSYHCDSSSTLSLPSVETIDDTIMINRNASVNTKEESKQLLEVTSSTSDTESDSEKSYQNENKLLIKKSNEDDIVELASLSSTEEENNSFNNGKLVLMENSAYYNNVPSVDSLTKDNLTDYNLESIDTLTKDNITVESVTLTNNTSPDDDNQSTVLQGNLETSFIEDNGDNTSSVSMTKASGSLVSTNSNSLPTESPILENSDFSKTSQFNEGSMIIQVEEIDEDGNDIFHERVPSDNSTESKENNESANLLSNHPPQLPHQSMVEESLNEEHEEDTTTEEEEGEMFLGSLGIEYDPGVWHTEIFDSMEVHYNRDEWNSTFAEITGDASKENWPTTINEIADSKSVSEDWKTSLPDIATNEVVEGQWSTHIAGIFENKELPEHWNTTFHKIKEVLPEDNKWTCIFRKIRKRVNTESEWKTTFNTIASNRTAKNDTWTTKIPKNLEWTPKENDWKTKINKIDRKIAEDTWTYKDCGMEVTSNDRNSNWNTTFKTIGERDYTTETWTTTFKTIAPNDVNDPKNTWSTSFNKLEENYSNPADWNIKFIDIEPVTENPWSIELNDTPNSYREPADWQLEFKTIVPVTAEENKWDTSFNDIIPNGDESHLWTNTFLSADISDMSRDTWETSFNNIIPNEDTNADWTFTVNQIEGMPE